LERNPRQYRRGSGKGRRGLANDARFGQQHGLAVKVHSTRQRKRGCARHRKEGLDEFHSLSIMHADGKAANNTNSVVATPAKSEPQLTAEQKEELANAQELFELGAYSEEEFEAEKQRITYGL